MPLAPSHYEQVAASSPGVSTEAAIEAICNDIVALPEHDVLGMPLHLPVTWLGTSSDEMVLDDDTMERLRRERTGWRKGPRILLVLPNPTHQDIEVGCALAPSTFAGAFLRKELELAGIALPDVMATHALRFALPSSMKSYKSQHQGANLGYVAEDVENCRPDVIITFGAAAVRSVMNKKTKLDSVRGSVHKYAFKDGTTCKIVPTCSVMSFFGSHADIDQFRLELARASLLLKGIEPAVAVENDYRTLTTAESVEALCAELTLDPPKRIAFDTEFGNDVAREEYRYTLSVQMAWGKGKAAFIQFRDQEPQADITEERPVRDKNGVPKIKKNGEPYVKVRTYNPGPKYIRKMSEADEKRCWAALQKLFLNPKIQLAGQHLRVDVEEFNRAGFNIDSRIPDGFDTMLVHYLLRGDDMHGLDWLVRTYAPEYGAYWQELEDWLDANGRAKCLRFGYRNVPPPIIIPYGLKDADATWVIAEKLEAELERFPKLKRLYWNYTSWTSLHLLDIERQGLLVDDERRMELREAYLPVYTELLDRLRTEINWPTFSPSSKQHVAYLLFNKHLYKDRDKGALEAPPDAKLLSLCPLYNTDKYPKTWEDVVLEGDEATTTPSTESDVFDILLGQHPDLKALTLLTHISVLSKFLSSYLAPIVMNEFGVPEDGKGFHNNIRSDHRVTTKLSQLTATGRYTSQKTNLQTSPKKQEAALFKALIYHKFGISQKEYERRAYNGDPDKNKPAYSGPDRIEVDDQIVLHKFKTCIVAPEGYSLIEVDFKTAELFVWAYASGDKALIDVVASGRDMHSEVAIMSYNLPMKAELPAAIDAFKKGDKAAYKAIVATVKSKYEALRTSAKACLAEGTPVLTERRGWVAIQDIELDDRIWDGNSWVTHEGIICKGERPVIDIAGVLLTSDHKIVTNAGWLDAAHVDQRTHLSKLGTYSSIGQLFLCPSAELALHQSGQSSDVSAGESASLQGTRTATSISENQSGARAVPCAESGAQITHQGEIRRAWLALSGIGDYGSRCSTGSAVLSHDATTSKARITQSTGGVVLTSTRPCRTPQSFWSTLKRCLDMTISHWRSIASTTIRGIGEVTSGFVRKTRTWLTAEIALAWNTSVFACQPSSSGKSIALATGVLVPSCVNYDMGYQQPVSSHSKTSATVRVYDIVNAGPNHRFQAGPLLVSNCIFGIMYGRSAGALSRALTSAGTPTTPEECQVIIEGIAKSYPVAWKWLKDNAESAVKNGYIENVFGARRYFPGVEQMTEGQRAAVQREAKNSPIQGAVAYLLAQAGINFYKFKYMTQRGRDLDFRILLPIHDAFLIEARDEHVPAALKLIDLCMSRLNKLPGTEYSLGVDIEVAKRWGEKAH